MAKNYYYSPATGEIINTTTPSDWMGVTAVAPPTYDASISGCFWRGAAWEVVFATLDKAPKKLQIEGWRDLACIANVSVTIGGIAYQFQADQRSQSLVSGAIVGVVAGISTPPVTWRSANNVDVPIAIGDLKAIGLALVNQTNTAYAHSWALKAQVDAATNQAQLDAIIW